MLEMIFGSDKKLIRIFIIVYILASIIILVLIWVPFTEKAPSFATYKEYTDEEILSKSSGNYLNDISLQFMLGQKESIANIIDNGYLDYTQQSREDVISMLESKKLFDINTKFGKVEVKQDGDLTVYSFDIINGDNNVGLNLIETFPFQYTLAFDSYVKYDKSNYIYKIDGIKFNIKSVYKHQKYIVYDIEITNEDNSYIILNTSAVKDIYASAEDDSIYNIVNPIVLSNDGRINKGSVIRFKINFEIPFPIQSTIEKLTFSDVSIGDEKKNISITIK